MTSLAPPKDPSRGPGWFRGEAFLPGDERDDGVSGRVRGSTTERWLGVADEDLQRLLAEDAPSPDDPRLRVFLDSYLAHRSRPHETAFVEGDELARSVDRRVLALLAREPALVDASRALALAALFGRSQRALVRKIFTAAHSDVAADLAKAALVAADALDQLRAKPTADAVQYVADAAASVAETAASSDAFARAFLATDAQATLAPPRLPVALAKLGDDARFFEAWPLVERCLGILAATLARAAASGDDPDAARSLVAWLAAAAAATNDDSVLARALRDDTFARDARQALRSLPEDVDATPAEYALAVLSSSAAVEEEKKKKKKKDPSAGALSDHATKAAPAAPKNARQDENLSVEEKLHASVEQAQAILPRGQYGDGFVAATLVALDMDVGIVVSRLLDGDVPAAVRHVDPSLARVGVATSESRGTRPGEKREAARFERDNKARIRALQQAEEDRARLRELAAYDDDYDDRFDEPDEPEVVGTALQQWANVGPDNNDYETIRRVNAIQRADEAEETYWDEAKNTNRAPHHKAEDQKNRAKATTRPPPAQRTQGAGRPKSFATGGSSASSKEPSKLPSGAAADPKKAQLDRRRNDKNKAAVGNHHRKDSAMRKASGGMFS